MTTRYTKIPSPLGGLMITRDEGGVTGLYLPSGRHPMRPEPDWQHDDAAFDDAREQLGQYFAGSRREFTLPLNPHGSDFQQRVWAALREIPYGATASYGATAEAIGLPVSGARAVGLANGQNPISIIVPCHRVIGADGSLTGYGGGLPAKQWLLDHESGQADLFAS